MTDLADLADAAHGHRLDDLLQESRIGVAHVLDHVRPGAPRPDAVDADPLPADLLGETCRDGVDRSLRPGIVDVSTRPAVARGRRGDVDDRATLAAVSGRHAPDRFLQ